MRTTGLQDIMHIGSKVTRCKVNKDVKALFRSLTFNLFSSANEVDTFC